MGKGLNFLWGLVLYSSCMPESKDKHLVYQNIVILADMSSRLKNARFPQKDYKQIHKIVQYFKSECVKPGDKIGDKSSITFSPFSERVAINIDLEKMTDLGDKQSFINSTNKYKNSGLDYELKIFEDSVKSLYERITNPGLDLISFLIEKIENENIVKEDRAIPNGVDTTFISYENHIYIFTDGYLEYKRSQTRQNNPFYFGEGEIESVRKYSGSKQLDVTSALQMNTALCLRPYKSKKNKFINLHVYETHERDKDTKFTTYRNNPGFRDNEILEAVWRKWAKESGFKDFEWKKY